MSGSSQTQPPDTGATGQVGLFPTPVFTPPTAGQTVLMVGAGEEFSTVSAAVAAASDGDLIEVQAGTYTNDFSVVNDSITIEGVGGMVNLVATVPPPDDKSIITTNADLTLENFSISGSAVPDSEGGNGAGIRYQGGNLTLINDELSDNQDGILADADPSGTITIDDSLFDDNGVSDPSLAGYGYTHGIYINEVGQLTIDNSIFEHANVGHEIKDRADNTLIENNIIQDTATGTASYSIDMPDGGNAVVENNTIEKGPDSQNNNAIHFGGEGIPYANTALTIDGNNFINDLGPQASMLLNQTISTVTVDSNAFDNFDSDELGSGPATYTDNWTGTGQEFADSTTTTFSGGLDTQYFTDDLPHSITLDGSVDGVVGGAGLLTIDDPAGHVTVLGGSGGIVFTEEAGAGGSTIITNAAATDTINVVGQDDIESAGTDVINAAAGNVTAAMSGDATVSTGSGADSWTVTGQALIDVTDPTATGSDSVNVMEGAVASVTGAGGYLQVVNAGGTADASFAEGGALLQESIVGGSSSTRMYSDQMNVTTAGGSAGSDITFGAGSVLMFSGGADTVNAGSGNETIIVSGAAQIFAGSGPLSVFGRSDGAGATVYGGGGTTLLDGDTGNIDYVGGAATSTVESNLSDDRFQGGSGHLTIDGPGSQEQINGGSGGITVNTAGGADNITTEAGAADSLTIGQAGNIISNGTDQLSLATGNFNVTVTGASTVKGSTGGSHYAFSGNDLLDSQGADYVQVDPGATLTMTADGPRDQVWETGGTVDFSGSTAGYAAGVTLSGGNGSFLYQPGQEFTVSESAGNATIDLGDEGAIVSAAGNDTVQFGGGTVTVGYGGTGRTFAFGATAAPSHVTIDEFVVGQDKFAFNAVSVVGQSVGSEGTTLTLSDGSAVLLANLTSPPDFVGPDGLTQQTLTTSGNKVTGGAAAIAIADDAGQNTIIGGAGGLTLQAAGAGDLVRTASGAHDQINLQLGGTVQSGGTDTISASGNSRILARGNASVTAGSGVMRFTGAGGASTLSGGSGTLIVFAGGGNVTLAGGSGNLRFVGGSGSASIAGGSGSDTVTFGAGHATVSASTRADLYRATEGVGGGSDLIIGFRAGTDHIDLHGYSQPPTETLAGSTLTLGLSDGTTIALAGVTHLASNSILTI